MVPMDVTKMTRRWTRVMHATNWFASAAEYWLDTCQKSLIYADILRKRGNIYIEHAKQGMPPVPVFDYETIVEGRDLERPVNYALVAIIDRRTKKPRRLKSRPERRKKRGGALGTCQKTHCHYRSARRPRSRYWRFQARFRDRHRPGRGASCLFYHLLSYS